MTLLVLSIGSMGCAMQRAPLPSEGEADFQRLEDRLESLRVPWRVPGMSSAVARDGICRFDDTNAPLYPYRFYRVTHQ